MIGTIKYPHKPCVKRFITDINPSIMTKNVTNDKLQIIIKINKQDNNFVIFLLI